MKANSIMLSNKDNVVTATIAIEAGEEILYLSQGQLNRITAIESIPAWNKAAITAITDQGAVIKYGEIIGAATENIQAGAYVSHLNIMSLPRNYEQEIE